MKKLMICVLFVYSSAFGQTTVPIEMISSDGNGFTHSQEKGKVLDFFVSKNAEGVPTSIYVHWTFEKENGSPCGACEPSVQTLEVVVKQESNCKSEIVAADIRRALYLRIDKGVSGCSGTKDEFLATYSDLLLGGQMVFKGHL